MCCIPAALLVLPLGMRLSLGLRESALLAVLFLCIVLWATGAAPKWLTALFLLVSFALISAVPLEKILQFPLSKNFSMILFSYLFSQGLQNSRVFELLLPVLQKRIRGTFTLAFSIFLCSFCMIWIIPQPFARIIILLQLYQTLFQAWGFSKKSRQILCLGIVHSSIIINCAFLRGDIILNYALVSTSGFPLTEKIWTDWMLLPTIVLYIAGVVLFFLVFRKDLAEIAPLIARPIFCAPPTDVKFSAIIACTGTVLLWLSEPWTAIPASATALAGSAAMAVLGYLKREDFKCIDLCLLIFLCAAFSIGPVMTDSGIAAKIFELLLPLLPKTFTPIFVISLILISMLFHLILGSCVTALSIMLPGIVLLCNEDFPMLPIIFITFLSVVCQYLFPLHNVSIMVGAGKGGYSDYTVFQWGLKFTLLILFAIPAFYGGYWYLKGFLMPWPDTIC